MPPLGRGRGLAKTQKPVQVGAGKRVGTSQTCLSCSLSPLDISICDLSSGYSLFPKNGYVYDKDYDLPFSKHLNLMTVRSVASQTVFDKLPIDPNHCVNLSFLNAESFSLGIDDDDSDCDEDTLSSPTDADANLWLKQLLARNLNNDLNSPGLQDDLDSCAIISSLPKEAPGNAGDNANCHRVKSRPTLNIDQMNSLISKHLSMGSRNYTRRNSANSLEDWLPDCHDKDTHPKKSDQCVSYFNKSHIKHKSESSQKIWSSSKPENETYKSNFTPAVPTVQSDCLFQDVEKKKPSAEIAQNSDSGFIWQSPIVDNGNGLCSTAMRALAQEYLLKEEI